MKTPIYTKLKICIKCKHCILEDAAHGRIPDTESGYGHYCDNVINVVTGESTGLHACCFARGMNAPCGPDAKLFEAKP